jgi:hypothetical protein
MQSPAGKRARAVPVTTATRPLTGGFMVLLG